MHPNAILFGWNRALPGRERLSAQHFQDFVAYLEGLRQAGTIQGYDPVFLDPHGGDLNGFFLLRGDAAKLDAVVASKDWQEHMVRALFHLEGSGAVRAYVGEAVPARMEVWKQNIPD